MSDSSWKGIRLEDMSKGELIEAMEEMAAGYEARLADVQQRWKATSPPSLHVYTPKELVNELRPPVGD